MHRLAIGIPDNEMSSDDRHRTMFVQTKENF